MITTAAAAVPHLPFHLTAHWVLAGVIVAAVFLIGSWARNRQPVTTGSGDGALAALLAVVAALVAVVVKKGDFRTVAPPKAAPHPVPTRTVIVQHTVTHDYTKVIHAGPALAGWALAAVIIAALAIGCAMYLGRRH